MSAKITDAAPVFVNKFADCGPGSWWFVHHPDGFLLECGDRIKAEQIAAEINVGRAAISKASLDASEQFAQWANDGPSLAKAAGCYVGITISALSNATAPEAGGTP